MRIYFVAQWALLSLAVVSCISACEQSRSTTTSYSNRDLGLRLTYPSTWAAVEHEKLINAIDTSPTMVKPKATTLEEVKTVVPLIVFAIAKSQNIGGLNRNPSVMVMVEDVADGPCAEINKHAFLLDDLHEYTETIPGAAVTKHFLIQTEPALQGYSIEVALRDRIATQHQYFYCHSNHYVRIGSTSSRDGDELEVEKILASIQIDGI